MVDRRLYFAIDEATVDVGAVDARSPGVYPRKPGLPLESLRSLTVQGSIILSNGGNIERGKGAIDFAVTDYVNITEVAVSARITANRIGRAPRLLTAPGIGDDHAQLGPSLTLFEVARGAFCRQMAIVTRIASEGTGCDRVRPSLTLRVTMARRDGTSGATSKSASEREARRTPAIHLPHAWG